MHGIADHIEQGQPWISCISGARSCWRPQPAIKVSNSTVTSASGAFVRRYTLARPGDRSCPVEHLRSPCNAPRAVQTRRCRSLCTKDKRRHRDAATLRPSAAPSASGRQSNTRTICSRSECADGLAGNGTDSIPSPSAAIRASACTTVPPTCFRCGRNTWTWRRTIRGRSFSPALQETHAKGERVKQRHCAGRSARGATY